MRFMFIRFALLSFELKQFEVVLLWVPAAVRAITKGREPKLGCHAERAATRLVHHLWAGPPGKASGFHGLINAARRMPFKSGRGSSHVRPASRASLATAGAWPWPSSSTASPPGESSLGRAAMMAR